MHFNLKNYGFGFAIFLIVIFQTEGFSKQVFSKKLMGTEVQIMVDADDSPSLKNAVNSAFKEGKRLNLILSDYDATSELSRLSRSSENGNPFTISKELLEVLTFGQQLAQISNGAFDVTMGPLTRLWRIARHQKKLPATEKINLALGRTGYQKLLINKSPPSATLTVPGMVLDLGGIAKGYVADRMLEVMRAEGYSRCLIDAGGDLTIGDPPRSRQGWRVQMGGLLTKELPYWSYPTVRLPLRVIWNNSSKLTENVFPISSIQHLE